jgi:hypothetical protein
MSTFTVIRIRKFKKDRQHNCQTKEKGQYRGRTRVHCNVIGRKCWEHLTVFGLTWSELGSKKYTSKGVFLSSVFCELFILCKMYTIYLIIGILYRYIMFGRGICEKYKSHGEGNLVSSLVFFANTPPKHDISV